MTQIIKQTETAIGKVIMEKINEQFYVHTESENDMVMTYEWFEPNEEYKAKQLFEKTIKKMEIVEVIHSYTQEMEGYSYYDSNPGVPQDAYEEIAQAIMNKWELK
jgi:hypothetical protein